MSVPPDSMPDFSVMDQILEQRLRDKGLQPRREERAVETGIEGLRLERGETEGATAEGMPFYVDSEINAVLNHPVLGKHTISDRVSVDAPTPAEALALCANAYMDVTFPAIHALFDETAQGARETSFIRVNRAREPIRWKCFHGELQVLKDATGEVTDYWRRTNILGLVSESVPRVIDGPPRLHWCKLYGSRTAQGLLFGCSIDGRKAGDAEAEMRRKFPSDLALGGQWEFRLFFTLMPAGRAGEDEVAAMRARGAEREGQSPPQPPPKKSWWPFGRRG